MTMNEEVKNRKKKLKRLNHWPKLSRVIQYLKDREYEEGGFSFVQDLYPNVEDTYYAIRTLQLLMADIDRIKTANYLKSIIWKEVYFPRIVYMLLYLHLSVDMELPVPLVNLLKKDWSKFQFLNAQYYSNEIQKLLNQPLKPLLFLSSFQFQAHENLQSLRKKVSVLIDLNIDFDRHEIIRWVQLCQNGDGGFGFYPETKTSYMENIFCALEILSKLQASPWRIDICRQYILGMPDQKRRLRQSSYQFSLYRKYFSCSSRIISFRENGRGR